MRQYQAGDVVRDRKWGGTCVGTIVGMAGGRVFVQWHGTCVEDELDPSEVQAAPEVPNPAGNGLRLLAVLGEPLDAPGRAGVGVPVYRSDRLGPVTIPEG